MQWHQAVIQGRFACAMIVAREEWTSTSNGGYCSLHWQGLHGNYMWAPHISTCQSNLFVYCTMKPFFYTLLLGHVLQCFMGLDFPVPPAADLYFIPPIPMALVLVWHQNGRKSHCQVLRLFRCSETRFQISLSDSILGLVDDAGFIPLSAWTSRRGRSFGRGKREFFPSKRRLSFKTPTTKMECKAGADPDLLVPGVMCQMLLPHLGMHQPLLLLLSGLGKEEGEETVWRRIMTWTFLTLIPLGSNRGRSFFCLRQLPQLASWRGQSCAGQLLNMKVKIEDCSEGGTQSCLLLSTGSRFLLRQCWSGAMSGAMGRIKSQHQKGKLKVTDKITTRQDPVPEDSSDQIGRVGLIQSLKAFYAYDDTAIWGSHSQNPQLLLPTQSVRGEGRRRGVVGRGVEICTVALHITG